jgi:cyclopropane fatty-acyl-phospholipid synthase-like methyltransferase
MKKPSQSELSKFLSEADINASFTDRLKIAYRPYICPFDDLLMLIQKGDKVFDIGCGSGQFLLLAAQFSEAAALYGIEISDRLIGNAKQQFARHAIKQPYHFSTFDGSNIPTEIADADKVFLIDVLHHVPEKSQKAFLQSIYAGMKPGAILVLKDIDEASVFVYFNKLHDLVLSKEIGHEISLQTAKQYTLGYGFEIKEESSKQMFWYPHYTLVLKKPEKQ